MGLKDVRVLFYERRGPQVELVIEQVVSDRRCPSCGGRATVKERPLVSYVDLPVYGTPMRLGWRKHRMRCPDPACPRRSWGLTDHRIAAKSCLLTTRAAKWATVQVGTGRTVKEVAAELNCGWHTVNDHRVVHPLGNGAYLFNGVPVCPEFLDRLKNSTPGELPAFHAEMTDAQFRRQLQFERLAAAATMTKNARWTPSFNGPNYTLVNGRKVPLPGVNAGRPGPIPLPIPWKTAPPVRPSASCAAAPASPTR